MEQNGAKNLRHVRSQSSDRFLDVFPLAKTQNNSNGGDDFSDGDELNEDDVFWSGDFSQGRNRKPNSPHAVASKGKEKRSGFKRMDSFGILAALPDQDDCEGDNSKVLCRKGKPSISPPSSSRMMIPATPKPPLKVLDREISQSMPIPMRNFHQSLPINVPVMSKAMERRGDLVEVADELFYGEKMLPPHEIVARGSANEIKTTFSMLEGAGRTLKGRDLRQVRNAVFRRTGFID